VSLQSASRFGLPAGLALFCWLTMRTVTSDGGESIASYGFPLPWCAASPASSGAFDIAVGPLLLDLACQGLAGAVLAAAWPALDRRPAAAIVAWLAAILSAGVLVFAVALDAQLVPWRLDAYFGGNALRTHALHLGPPRWSAGG